MGSPPSDHANNRIARIDTPVGRYEYKYDAGGRARESSLALPDGVTVYPRAFTFDWLGRVKTALYPDGELIQRTYDRMGLESISSSQQTYVLHIGYNAEGSLTRLQYGNGIVRSVLHYSSDGRPQVVVDDAGGATGAVLARLYDYDLTGKVSSISDFITPSETLTGLHYDAMGRLESATRAGGEDLSYDYDPLGNLIAKEGAVLPYQHPSKPHAVYDPARPNRWSYDPAGNLTRRDGEAIEYDARNRLIEIDGPLTSREFYDHAGERTKRMHGADTSLYFGLDLEIMNGKRMIKTIRAGGMSVARREVVVASAGAGTFAVRSREDWRRFLQVSMVLQVAAGSSFVGYVLFLRRRRGIGTLQPAFAGSLAIALIVFPFGSALATAPSGDLNSDGHLDIVDALLAERLLSGTIPEPSPEQLANADVAPLNAESDGEVGVNDFLLMLRGVKEHDVDADGLDSESELSIGTSPFRADSDQDGLSDSGELAQGLDPTDADWDEDGVLDGDELSGELDPFDSDSDDDGIVDGRDGTPLEFTGEQVHFLHTDHLGGTAVVTDLTRAVVRRVHYGIWGDIRADEIPVGAPESTPKPRESFTGQSGDPGTGFLYYGARFYDPTSGRFVQPDPIIPQPLNPQSLNRYAYVLNDPLNQIDPTGNFSFGGSFGGLGSTIGGWASSAWNTASSWLSGAGSFVGGMISSGLSSMFNMAKNYVNELQNLRMFADQAFWAQLSQNARRAVDQVGRVLSPFQQAHAEPAIGTPVSLGNEQKYGSSLISPFLHFLYGEGEPVVLPLSDIDSGLGPTEFPGFWDAASVVLPGESSTISTLSYKYDQGKMRLGQVTLLLDGTITRSPSGYLDFRGAVSGLDTSYTFERRGPGGRTPSNEIWTNAGRWMRESLGAVEFPVRYEGSRPASFSGWQE